MNFGKASKRSVANYAALHTIIIIVLWSYEYPCGCNFCVHTLLLLSRLFVGVMDVAIHGCKQKLVLHNLGNTVVSPGKCPLLGKHPCTCTVLQGATVAASIQTYGILILGKRPCRPKLQVM